MLAAKRRVKSAAGSRPFGATDLLVWVMLVAGCVALIVQDILVSRDLMLPQGAMIGRDFLNAWAGGQLTAQGHVEAIYSVDAYLDSLRGLLIHPIDFHAFSYPPTLLLFLWPLGFIAYLPALLIWIALTGAAFIIAARPYLARSGLPVWLAPLLPASIINVWAGHHGFVLAALWLTAFAVVPRRPVIAGLLIALLTLKPHMGVVIPLLLLIRGEWRTIAAAAFGTAILFLMSVAVFGWGVWSTYLEVTAGVQTSLLAQQGAFFLMMMPTPYISFWLASDSIPVAIAAHAAFAIAALWILVRATMRGVGWPELGLMAATATFLILPYAFNYDMAVVGIAAAILLYGNTARPGQWERLSALLVLGAPIFVLAMNSIALPVLPFALLGFLLTQARCYSQGSKQYSLPARELQPAAG